MLTLRWVDKFGYIFFISAISLLCKNLTEYIRAGLLRSNWIAKVHMAVNDCEISYFVFSPLLLMLGLFLTAIAHSEAFHSFVLYLKHFVFTVFILNIRILLKIVKYNLKNA